MVGPRRGGMVQLPPERAQVSDNAGDARPGPGKKPIRVQPPEEVPDDRGQLIIAAAGRIRRLFSILVDCGA